MPVTIILGILSGIVTLLSVWALIAVSRLLLRDFPRHRRHFRFGLLELLLVVGVIAAWCGMLRAGWDSWTIGPMLLFIPPSIVAIGLVRFALEDKRLQRERRQMQLQAPPPAAFDHEQTEDADALRKEPRSLWKFMRGVRRRHQAPEARSLGTVIRRPLSSGDK